MQRLHQIANAGLQLAAAESSDFKIAGVGIWNLSKLPIAFRVRAQHIKFVSKLRVERQQLRFVLKVHRQDTICPLHNFAGQRLGSVLSQRNTEFRRRFLRPKVRFTPRIRMQPGRDDLELLFSFCLPERSAHQKFRHGAAHNVAEANENERPRRRRNKSATTAAKPHSVQQS